MLKIALINAIIAFASGALVFTMFTAGDISFPGHSTFNMAVSFSFSASYIMFFLTTGGYEIIDEFVDYVMDLLAGRSSDGR